MTAIAPITVETGLGGQLVGDISSSVATISVRHYDIKTGLARTPLTSTRLLMIDKDNSDAEWYYSPDVPTTTSGVTTYTNCVRGVSPSATSLSAGTGTGHGEGASVGSVTSHHPINILSKILDGTNGSGANILRIGDETDSNVTFYAQNADASKPFLRYDAAANKWVFSNDGVSSGDVGGGTGSITGGDGITVTAGDVDIDLTDTAIFLNTSAGVGSAGKAVLLDAAGRLASTITGATYTEIAQLSGTTNIAEANTFFGATNMTGAEAETLSDGSNADSLHVHRYNKRLVNIYTAVTITGTVTETNLISETIIGGTLGTTGAIRVRAYISALSVTNGQAFAIRLKYGGTTYCTIDLTNSSGGNITGLSGFIEGVIMANNATSSQVGFMTAHLIQDGITSSNISLNVGLYWGSNTKVATAIDSTANQTLALTGDFDSSGAGNNITMHCATIEAIL